MDFGALLGVFCMTVSWKSLDIKHGNNGKHGRN